MKNIQYVFMFIAVFLGMSSFQLHANPVSKPATTNSQIAKIDLNKADLQILTHCMKGIGPKRAAAILAYRQEHQNFKSVEELAQVKGFGEKFVSKNLIKLKELFVVG